MYDEKQLLSAKRVGTGIAFIILPLVFVFAFATHPDLLNPHFLGPEELILRAHRARVLHFGHALVTLDTALLVVVALHFMTTLEGTTVAWPAFIGGSLAIALIRSRAIPRWHIVMAIYCAAVIAVAVFGSLFFVSSDCIPYEQCSRPDDLVFSTIGIVMIPGCGIALVQGWRGRLPGARPPHRPPGRSVDE
jgi:hypothetical protein